jgi:hypothetical protein
MGISGFARRSSCIIGLLTLTVHLWSADLKTAKIVQVRDASFTGAGISADASLGVATTPSEVPAYVQKCLVTVLLDGTEYSAIYSVDKHFKMTDFVEGEQVPARIEGNKLVLRRLDGKDMKAKILPKDDKPRP